MFSKCWSWLTEKAMAPYSSTLAWKIPWAEEPGGLQSMGSLGVRHDWATSLSLFTFMPLEKEMAAHSSVLAWRIPGTRGPGGLTSMGSHRVGHDWSDLAAAAAAFILLSFFFAWTQDIVKCKKHPSFRGVIIKKTYLWKLMNCSLLRWLSQNTSSEKL